MHSEATLIDCTAGDCGHTIGFLQAAGPASKALALDRDPVALDRSRARLRIHGIENQVTLVQSDFADLGALAAKHGFHSVDNVLMDLGYSSQQIETGIRGFSFLRDGPLDMRMDRRHEWTAADIVNTFSQEKLTELLFKYGEEPQARRIASAIVRNRPFADTLTLADTIAGARRQRGHARLHPATRSFQALRIAVNDELGQLQLALPQALAVLAPGGHICVISFHSLEDRRVKEFMYRHSERRAHNKYAEYSSNCQTSKAPLKLLHRRVVKPSPPELKANPRSRSARLRAACLKEICA